MTGWATSASTERVDQLVTKASVGLAAWLVRPQHDRVDAVRRFARDIVEQLDRRQRSIGPTLAMHHTAEPAMRRATDRLLDWCDHGLGPADPSFRPGIVALVHERDNGAFDHRFPCAIFAALLSDSVVVVRSNDPFDIVLPPAIEAAEAARLPAECVWWLRGDDEAVDALVSNPSIASVLVDGSPEQRARIEHLGQLFDKPVLAYRADPRFA